MLPTWVRPLRVNPRRATEFAADHNQRAIEQTALFEIEPVAARAVAVTPALDPNELLTMKVRYKKPGGALARKIDFPLFDSRTRFVDASADFKFAAAVAGLGIDNVVVETTSLEIPEPADGSAALIAKVLLAAERERWWVEAVYD